MQNVQRAQADRNTTDTANDGQPSHVAREAHASGTLQPESSTHREQTPPPANIHLQRLAAIGNFLIGRRPPAASKPMRRPRPSQQQQQQQHDISAPNGGKMSSNVRTQHNEANERRTQSTSGDRIDVAVLESFVQESSGPPPPAGQNPPSHKWKSQDLSEPLSTQPSDASEVSGPPVWLPAGGVVVDELFENERRQPFRGWGHSWPGHFLPTDPVGHWCRQSGRSAGRGTSFEENVPPVPEGWVACAPTFTK
jgi:hypothetical protein